MMRTNENVPCEKVISKLLKHLVSDLRGKKYLIKYLLQNVRVSYVRDETHTCCEKDVL